MRSVVGGVFAFFIWLVVATLLGAFFANVATFTAMTYKTPAVVTALGHVIAHLMASWGGGLVAGILVVLVLRRVVARWTALTFAVIAIANIAASMLGVGADFVGEQTWFSWLTSVAMSLLGPLAVYRLLRGREASLASKSGASGTV